MREQLKKALDEKRAEAKRLYDEFDVLRKKAVDEGADLTTGDAFDKLEEAHKSYATVSQEAATLEDRLVKAIDMEAIDEPKANPFNGNGNRAAELVKAISAGSRVLESDAYKALKDSGFLDTNDVKGLKLDPVKALDRAELKTLLTGASDTSAGALIVEDRQAGLVDLPRRVRVLTDLITVGDTDSDVVEYVEMTSRTNNAAETPEATSTSDVAANAPESGFALVVKTVNVREVTHFIPATRRALADAGQLRTLIDQELREGILERLDGQLVSGTGVGENLRGILETPGISGHTIGLDSLSDAVHKAITKVELEEYMVDAVLFHPSDWESVRLEKDNNGQYLYGPPSQPGPSTIWGVPAVKSKAVPQGTILPGGFRRGATLWIRSGVNISATDSHDDWFIRRLVAVLATFRGAYTVQRPKAFCEITA